MPIYEYRCTAESCGCWQATFRKQSTRDTGAPACLECGSPSVRGIFGELAHTKAPPLAGVVEEEPFVREPGLLDKATGRRYRLSDRVCTDESCGHTDETEEVWLDDAGETAEPNPVCSKCGGLARWEAIAPAHSRFSEVFPYFDVGAGRRFNNKRERRDWMRANGLEEAGDMRDVCARAARAMDDEDRQIVEAFERDQDEARHHADTRRVYAELAASGRITTG